MAYPQKLLNPGETVALDLHPHWWFFAKPVAALIAGIIAGILLLAFLGDGTPRETLLWIVLAAIIVTGVWTVIRYFKWTTTNFVITSDRVIFRQGVIGKSGIEIPLDRVNNVNFKQSAFERIIKAGDLLIESGGEDGQQRFTDVRNPQSVQNLIHAQAEIAVTRRRGGSTPSPVNAVDVASQLEKLEGLLQRGSLTQEEYNAQKQRLLSS